MWPYRTEQDLSVKDFIQKKSLSLFLQLESTVLANWVWGPRQNKEASSVIIRPLTREQLAKMGSAQTVRGVLNKVKKEIKRILSPNLIVTRTGEVIEDLAKYVTDESQFVNGYAFDEQVLKDFDVNVGRKLHILKVAMKVTI